MQHHGIEEPIATAIVADSVPGVQVGLLRGDDRLVASDGVRSMGSEELVERSTPFHAGSIAKSVAALVVVDAARRGDLELDVPCSEQASGLWDDTPRTLLAQTSGRPNELPGDDEDIEAFVDRVGEQPRVHEAGRFSYCNTGWSVLDLLLRRRTCASFEELARDRILGAAAPLRPPRPRPHRPLRRRHRRIGLGRSKRACRLRTARRRCQSPPDATELKATNTVSELARTPVIRGNSTAG